jgi:hypothetical protein
MVPWPYCFWACGKAKHHGWEHTVEQSCLPHGGQEAREKGKKRLVSLYALQEHSPEQRSEELVL